MTFGCFAATQLLSKALRQRAYVCLSNIAEDRHTYQLDHLGFITTLCLFHQVCYKQLNSAISPQTNMASASTAHITCVLAILKQATAKSYPNQILSLLATRIKFVILELGHKPSNRYGNGKQSTDYICSCHLETSQCELLPQSCPSPFGRS